MALSFLQPLIPARLGNKASSAWDVIDAAEALDEAAPQDPMFYEALAALHVLTGDLVLAKHALRRGRAVETGSLEGRSGAATMGTLAHMVACLRSHDIAAAVSSAAQFSHSSRTDAALASVVQQLVSLLKDALIERYVLNLASMGYEKENLFTSAAAALHVPAEAVERACGRHAYQSIVLIPYLARKNLVQHGDAVEKALLLLEASHALCLAPVGSGGSQ